MLKHLTIIVFSLLWCKLLSAQIKDADLINFTQKDGLPSNEAYCVFKDSKNYIWIGTDQGVVRFSGSKMEKFELPDNVVFKIKEDNRGRVWFFTHSGKLCYCLNEKIYSYKYNDSIAKNIKNLVITDAYVTNDDEILLNSVNISNYRITSKGNVINEKNNISTKLNAYNLLIIPQRNDELFTQKLNMEVVNFSNLNFYFANNPLPKYSISTASNDAFTHYGSIKLPSGSIIFWGGKKLIRLNVDGTYSYKEFTKNILSIYLDKIKNTMWVGFTKNGISSVDTAFNTLQNNSLNNISITSITQDLSGSLWFTSLESGVFTLRNFMKQIKLPSRNLNVETYRLFNYKDSVLLIADINGVAQVSNNKLYTLLKWPNRRSGDLFVDENNIYWANVRNDNVISSEIKLSNSIFKKIIISGSGYELLEYDEENYIANLYNGFYTLNRERDSKNNGLAHKSNCVLSFDDFRVQTAYKKSGDNIVLGTLNNLLNYSILTKSVTPFKKAKSILNNGITTIRQLPNFIFTFGIRFGGLALMKDTTIIGTITEQEGLLDNSIKYILPDGNRLWAATSKGISCISFTSYNPLVYTIKNFGEDVGLSDQIIYQLIKYQGNILAATSKGVYEINNVEKLLSEKPIQSIIYSKNNYNN